MGNSNLAIRCAWREIEWVDGGAHMKLRRPKVIKGGSTLIFDHLLHLQTNTYLYALLLSESTDCLTTSLPRGRFNLYFGGPPVPTLGSLFHRDCMSFQQRFIAQPATQGKGLHVFWVARNMQRLIQPPKRPKIQSQNQRNFLLGFVQGV